jgi:Zn-dependent protease
VEDPQAPIDIYKREAYSSIRTYLVHALLFALTFCTTTVAGVQWLNKNPFELTNFWSGATYATLILVMLASHEFGHYFAAHYHGVKATLPFFIPFPSYFGTMGAVIRLRSAIPSRKVMFDVGSAGPIAGFIVSIAILVFGFVTLPPKEYLYSIHPEYAQFTSVPTGGLTFGSTLLFSFLSHAFSPSGAFVPPMNEIYHYPFLCVGWFGTFVTAMNLIPVGQLDGGHITYSMFGERHHLIARVSLVMLVIAGVAGFLPLVGIESSFGWTGWLFWALILILSLRVFKLNRPPIEDDTPLDATRLTVGWLCIGIFVSSFSITPFSGL